MMCSERDGISVHARNSVLGSILEAELNGPVTEFVSHWRRPDTNQVEAACGATNGAFEDIEERLGCATCRAAMRTWQRAQLRRIAKGGVVKTLVRLALENARLVSRRDGVLQLTPEGEERMKGVR